MNTEPNYKTYSLESLYDVRENIDKAAYPQRFAQIEAEIALREADQSYMEEYETEQNFKTTEYSLLAAFFLSIGYAAYALYFLEIPLRRWSVSFAENPQTFILMVFCCMAVAIAAGYKLFKFYKNNPPT